MSSTSTVANDIRETVKEAGEGVRETRKVTAEAGGDIQRDLQALRDDFARLAEQVSAILASTGNAAWRRAKSSVDGAVADAQDKGREAAEAVREVSDHFMDAVDESLKTRPYATLALVAGVAFLFGATWRR